VKKLLFIDDEEEGYSKNSEKGIFYAWNGRENSNISLSNFILKNKSSLREDYLEFIENVKKNNNNISDIVNFKIYSKYNIFEMSNIYEKNIFKSPKIIDCIKLLAINKIIKIYKLSGIKYYGSNSNIYNSLNFFCKNNNLIFYSKNNIKLKINFRFTALNFLKSVFFLLIYFIKRFNLLNYKKKNFILKENEILIFSYYVHLQKNKSTNLWGNLGETLNKKNYKINWLHDFSPSNQVPNSKTFLNNIRLLNNKKNNHIPIDSFLNFFSIIKIFINLFRVYINFFFINLKKIFFYKKNKINFFYFLENDFKKSIFGPDLVKNLIYIEIYENLFSKISKTKFGLYLLENQAWESIMINAWRFYKHGILIGSINSTVRDWDLRYFKSQKKIFKKKLNSPDYIAVNGELTKKSITKNNLINKHKIFQVEAVRYNYLNKIGRKNKIKNSVIIFGDISINANYEILIELKKSLKFLNKKLLFYYKPHPTLPKKVVDDLLIRFKFLKKMDKMNINYNQFQYCICSETTSAILEAIYFGLKTSIFVSKNSINLSPLPSNLWKNYLYNYKDIINFFINSSKNEHIFINKLIDINSKNKKWLTFIKNKYSKIY
tara:strand:- start:5107 stop:6915 length:1809 start_codon:yes stop_codon:yes gene_type:complete